MKGTKMELAPIAVGIPEACRLLGVGRTLLYDALKSGQLPTVRLGKRRLIPMTALQAFIANKTT
jgi:excisionase family DNA binding protein